MIHSERFRENASEILADMQYVCIACRQSPLSLSGKSYRCPDCDTSYPVHHGLPLFVRDIHVDMPEAAPDLDEQVTAVLRTFDFAEDARAAVAGILATRYEFPQQGYSAENNCVTTRIRAASRPDDDSGNPRETGDQHATVVRDYLPDLLMADSTSTYNVRLRNTGQDYLSSKGGHPVHISYHWYASDGSLVEFDGLRTRFPVDVEPGRAITVPVSLKTPAIPGRYSLHLDLVCEGVAWGGLAAWSKTVTVDEGRPAIPKVKPAAVTYSEDHEAARALLGSWLPGRPVKILEIGGTASPQTTVYGHEVWNVDIDVQSLRIGMLHYERMPDRKCTFVCADAGELPFAARSFDCIALFSALHHFEDPAATVRYLSGFLARDGFLAVMCEPVGHNVADEQYLHELRAGINEQTFSVEEWILIFRRAGVRVADIRAGDGSLKAKLIPSEKS